MTAATYEVRKCWERDGQVLSWPEDEPGAPTMWGLYRNDAGMLAHLADYATRADAVNAMRRLRALEPIQRPRSVRAGVPVGPSPIVPRPGIPARLREVLAGVLALALWVWVWWEISVRWWS
ncbi:MAG: hypothetical protein ACKVW3_01765 [Phycisphaerales bacterium]